MIGAVAIGFAAGALAGLLGVGGGTLFVPALVLLLGLAQVDAEATSLLAIVPVALVGAWRQHRYGNLRLRDGVVIGVLAVPGAVAGVVLANAVPERALELGFAALLVAVAVRARRARCSRRRSAATVRRATGSSVPSCSASTAVPFGCERSSTACARLTRARGARARSPPASQSSSSWPSGARSTKSPSSPWIRA